MPIRGSQRKSTGPDPPAPEGVPQDIWNASSTAAPRISCGTPYKDNAISIGTAHSWECAAARLRRMVAAHGWTQITNGFTHITNGLAKVPNQWSLTEGI